MHRQLRVFVVAQVILLYSIHGVAIVEGSGTDKPESDISQRIVCAMFEKALAAARDMGLTKDETVALFNRAASATEYVEPILKLSHPSIDLGEISSTRISRATVSIRNTGDTAIVLTAKTTCGCTQCQLGTQAVQPGEATTLEVMFNPGEKNTGGEVVEHVALLYVQDGVQRKTLIPVRARIREYFRVTPGEINFGDIHRGSVYSTSIHIECTDPQWVPRLTVHAPPEFDVSVEEPELDQRAGARVQIRKNKQYLSGKYGRDIVLTTELHGQSNEIRVPIYGRLWDTSIRCEPATAEIGFIGPRETKSLACTLTSLDKSPYVIEKVSSDLGEVKWRVQNNVEPTAPNRSHRVQLELKANAQTRDVIRGNIWFDVRHSGKPQRVTMEVRGYYYDGALDSR